MKVVIVDDEEDVRTLFEQKFRREVRAGQIELFFALSAEAALQLLEQRGVADIVLILSDINMPGMNGLELLKALKSRYPHLKVYMITAYADEENHQRAVAYGCDDYLTKPIDFNVLRVRMGLTDGEDSRAATQAVGRGGWRGRLRPRVSRAAAGTDGARTRLLCETPAALVGSRSTAASCVCAPPGRGCPGRRAVGAVPTAIARLTYIDVHRGDAGARRSAEAGYLPRGPVSHEPEGLRDLAGHRRTASSLDRARAQPALDPG